MKSLFLFYLGAGIDLIALLIAVGMMLVDQLKGTRGTNNPTMLTACLILGAFIAAAFWLKSSGRAGLATGLVWVPGLPLAGYGLIILLFVVLKPDMR